MRPRAAPAHRVARPHGRCLWERSCGLAPKRPSVRGRGPRPELPAGPPAPDRRERSKPGGGSGRRRRMAGRCRRSSRGA
ncbi:MAG: hypothetical protein FJW40_04525 [Acidobacteria bacterium]|nr:hypothetical protein [Acidobacteriota bacterium]